MSENKTIVIGLTGKMASGKNFACSILEKFGCVSTDADKLAHKAIEICKNQIFETFKDEAREKNISITDENGNINRRELAKIVFSSKENLKKQEAIVHPQVEKMIQDFIRQNQGKIIILNATVLYKTQVVKNCDAIIFVDAPPLVRFFRVKKRDGLKAKNIFQRFYSQRNLFTKYKKLNSDIYKVMNFSSAKKLEKKLNSVLHKIISL